MGSGEWGVGDEGAGGDEGDEEELLNKFLPCLFPMPNAPCPMPNAQCPMPLTPELHIEDFI
ncbi:hypothetical protein [Nostoc sp. CHAB 5715]|uniref:hypothetical protein n=1 Tax=Nostoc sp. CHAB 5715 TaxID=2780400 RepID=UPI001E3A5E0E|nr:hypothetical protein [Nostoc sp. CHAB 5715]MCC5625018.1 hypothetical protein [Nostoc sp. CHAB 5715]